MLEDSEDHLDFLPPPNPSTHPPTHPLEVKHHSGWVGVWPMSWEASCAIRVKWKWSTQTNKICPPLCPCPDRTLCRRWRGFLPVVPFVDFCLFVCLFGLAPMDTQHGGREDEREREHAWHTGPPLEVTRDLPRDY